MPEILWCNLSYHALSSLLHLFCIMIILMIEDRKIDDQSDNNYTNNKGTDNAQYQFAGTFTATEKLRNNLSIKLESIS